LAISGIIQKENTLETLKQEMAARQKVVEECIKFQNEKIKLLEGKIRQPNRWQIYACLMTPRCPYFYIFRNSR